MAGIQVDDATMRDVVSAAILKTMTDDSRAMLVQNAVKSLLEPPLGTGHYDADKRSRIQRLFDEVMYGYAREEIAKALKDDDAIRGKLRELVAKGLEKLMTDTESVDAFASGLAAVFRKAGDRY